MLRYTFWFILFFLIPGLLLRFGIGGAGILALDVILPLFIGLWVWQKCIIERRIEIYSPFKPFLVFIGIASISLILATAFDITFSEIAVSAGYVIRLIAFVLFGYTAYEIAQDTKNKFWKNLFSISFIVLLLGFVQFYIYPDLGDISTKGGWDPHVGRLLGTWMDPNYMAGFLSFLICVLLGYWYNKKDIKNKTIIGLFIIFCLYALFLTFSRGGYLSVAMGLGFYLLIKDPKVLLLMIAVSILGISTSERAQERLGGFAGTVQALILNDTTEIDPTANLRMISWRKSLKLFEENPIIGIGYNTYRVRAAQEGVVNPKYFSSGGADSTHLTVLITTGVIGFMSYLIFIMYFFLVPLRRYFKNKDNLHLAFSAGWLSLLVHSSFVNSLFFPLLFLPVIAVYGFIMAKKTIEQPLQ